MLNYIFQLLHSSIDEERSLLVNNQIYSQNTSLVQQPIEYFTREYRSLTKYFVLHDGMITWNSLPDVFKSTYP